MEFCDGQITQIKVLWKQAHISDSRLLTDENGWEVKTSYQWVPYPGEVPSWPHGQLVCISCYLLYLCLLDITKVSIESD